MAEKHEESRKNIEAGYLSWKENVTNNWQLLREIPAEARDYNMCFLAIGMNKNPLPFIKNYDDRPSLSNEEYKSLCLKAIQFNPDALQDVHPDLLDKHFYETAIRNNHEVFKFIRNPENYPDEKSNLSMEDYNHLQVFSIEQKFSNKISIDLDDLIEYTRHFQNITQHESVEQLNKYVKIINLFDSFIFISRFSTLNDFIKFTENLTPLTQDEKSRLFRLMSARYKYIMTEQMDKLKLFFQKDGAEEISKIEK